MFKRKYKDMTKQLINISLTEFMNYVNKSGSAKVTVVTNALNNRENDYQFYKDYWLKLREKIKEVHKKKLSKDDLRELLDEVSPDKQANYNSAIEGYCRFWGSKKITWVKTPRKKWAIDNLRIELNPELGLNFKGKTYFIKLFTKANDKLDKRHADLILALMEHELREKVNDENAVFAVLDIKRGKLFEYSNSDRNLYILLESEAMSFKHTWENL